MLGIFPNCPSVGRLIDTQLMTCHEKWVYERTRYLNLEQYDDWADAAKDGT